MVSPRSHPALRHSLSLFAVSAALLPCLSIPVQAQAFICSNTALSPIVRSATPGYDHRRYAPIPSPDDLHQEFAAYFAVFDGNDDDDGDDVADYRANPEWVAYEIKAVAPDASGNFPEPDVSIDRPDNWYREPHFIFLRDEQAGVARNRINNSYTGIGSVWNRGHLAMSDHAQRISAEAACNTHHFWNAVPQAADMNQGPWRHLENYSAAAASKFGRLWVITGPIFDEDTAVLTIGDAGEMPVAVPHALFKVLVRETDNGPDALAFIFEQPAALDTNGDPAPTDTWVNCNQANAQNHTYDHRAKLVSIRDIELRTGLTFYPWLPPAIREGVVDATPQELWTVEPNFWDANAACAGQGSHP